MFCFFFFNDRTKEIQRFAHFLPIQLVFHQKKGKRTLNRKKKRNLLSFGHWRETKLRATKDGMRKRYVPWCLPTVGIKGGCDTMSQRPPSVRHQGPFLNRPWIIWVQKCVVSWWRVGDRGLTAKKKTVFSSSFYC